MTKYLYQVKDLSLTYPYLSENQFASHYFSAFLSLAPFPDLSLPYFAISASDLKGKKPHKLYHLYISLCYISFSIRKTKFWKILKDINETEPLHLRKDLKCSYQLKIDKVPQEFIYTFKNIKIYLWQVRWNSHIKMYKLLIAKTW